MNFYDLPAALKAEVSRIAQEAVPDVKVYADYITRMERPAVLVLVGPAAAVDIRGAEVRYRFDVTVTGYAKVAADQRSHFEKMDRMGAALLYAFTATAQTVGGLPMEQSLPVLRMEDQDAVELSFSLFARLVRAEGGEGGAGSGAPMMEHLHTAINEVQND